jgi:hypothetical protein
MSNQDAWQARFLRAFASLSGCEERGCRLHIAGTSEDGYQIAHGTRVGEKYYDANGHYRLYGASDDLTDEVITMMAEQWVSAIMSEHAHFDALVEQPS